MEKMQTKVANDEFVKAHAHKVEKQKETVASEPPLQQVPVHAAPPLLPINLNGQTCVYPALQYFLTAPQPMAHKTDENTQTSDQKLQTALKKASKDEIDKFKAFTANSRNQSDGIEFFFDKRGCLYSSPQLRVLIKQVACFQEEPTPHVRFALTFQNATFAPLNHFHAKIGTTSTNYTLIANSKKLSDVLEPGTDQRLGFALFPVDFPVDGLKLSVSFNWTDKQGKSKRSDLALSLPIPFHKFLKFSRWTSESAKFDRIEERSLKYSEKLLRCPDELLSLLPGIEKTAVDQKTLYRGSVQCIVDASLSKLAFEAELSSKTRQMRFALRFKDEGAAVRELASKVADQLLSEFEMRGNG